jgi:hypothetical protein
VQQSATVEVRFCALQRQIHRTAETTVLSRGHAGEVLVCVVVAKGQIRICKPSVVGSIPTAGSSLKIPPAFRRGTCLRNPAVSWIVRSPTTRPTANQTHARHRAGNRREIGLASFGYFVRLVATYRDICCSRAQAHEGYETSPTENRIVRPSCYRLESRQVDRWFPMHLTRC